MSTLVLTDCTVYVGGYDLSSDLNRVALTNTADELDATVFGGDGYRARKGGLKSTDVSHDGYTQYADPDSTLFAGINTERVFTVTPTGVDGDVAYTLKATRLNYTPVDDEIGQLARFAGSAMSSGGVATVRSRLLLPKQNITGSTTGTGVQLGAVGATESLYTSVHVFTAGTTADVIVESDDNAGFTSATTRSTTTVTATGGTWVTPVAGAITDDYWRVRIASVTGTFSIAVAVGIQ